jgi:hypothetical protein
MNEKIKTILRIVKPPGYIPLGYYTPQGSFNSWGMSDEELQKFAELIIRECLEACSRANDIRHLVPPTQQQVVLSCMDEIERTFRS